MADEPNAADAIELSVPGDATTLSDAIRLGRQRCKAGDSGLVTELEFWCTAQGSRAGLRALPGASLLVKLAAEHREPQEAWPLEIVLQEGRELEPGSGLKHVLSPLHFSTPWKSVAGDCLGRLSVTGATNSTARLGDVQLASTDAALCMRHVVCGSLTIASRLPHRSKVMH